MSQVKSASPNWFLRLAVAAVVVAGIAYGVSYTLRPVALVAPAVTAIAVRTVPGTVEVKAEFAIELKSEVGGRVSASSLDVGKRVYKNDTLVQIDTGDVDLDIERIKNEITAAKRKVELGSTLRPEVLNSKDTLDNLERQTKAGAYPAAEFEKQRRLHQQLEQKMELDEVNNRLALENWENSLRAKEREKAKMTVIAPSDGVVTSVTTRVGDLIGSNSPIATIIAVGRTVEAKISEENFAAIKLGQKASVRFLTFGADQYNAKISKILPSADAATQRYTLFLDIALPEGRVLLPGLTGEVSIIIAERANAVTIPRRALVGDYIYVVAGGQLERRKITKGYEGLNSVEILSGLAAGELVVVEQQDRFREGERVRTQVLSN
ncbi:efflux RND transporter periplasmic adaptor subunit [Opitutus sp. GAS368]|uniref:efflux RND transporter periplasmic adaptor subunit n=1 Tax=Opitutus sp. GAS368 TaxID=1882749 RepID=UPI00087BEE3D|nr:efflux RND transporter periplasmic adaptor subunit [Opitutus sp. GAS368]SDS27623.1 RND family efflux transporter, MFP subunit [Opitutus sp. GAS368]